MAAQLSPKDLKARLDANEPLTMIDVREDWEVALGKLPDAAHIVMNTIPDHLDEIPKDRPVVFICRSGQRSEAVANWVQAQGWTNVLNLTGGVQRWMQDVDPTFPGRY
jgi:rhodanese-related sulfurtransferase